MMHRGLCFTNDKVTLIELVVYNNVYMGISFCLKSYREMCPVSYYMSGIIQHHLSSLLKQKYLDFPLCYWASIQLHKHSSVVHSQFLMTIKSMKSYKLKSKLATASLQ